VCFSRRLIVFFMQMGGMFGHCCWGFSFFGKIVMYLRVSQSITVAKSCGDGWRKLVM
jgi:hypothetical protein